MSDHRLSAKMPFDTICFMCGDILELRSKGPCRLAYHVGPDDHERWEVWRCRTCGFLAMREAALRGASRTVPTW